MKISKLPSQSDIFASKKSLVLRISNRNLIATYHQKFVDGLNVDSVDYVDRTKGFQNIRQTVKVVFIFDFFDFLLTDEGVAWILELNHKKIRLIFLLAELRNIMAISKMARQWKEFSEKYLKDTLTLEECLELERSFFTPVDEAMQEPLSSPDQSAPILPKKAAPKKSAPKKHQIKKNTFVLKPIAEELQAAIKHFCVEQVRYKGLVIAGLPKSGKTTLLQQLKEQLPVRLGGQGLYIGLLCFEQCLVDGKVSVEKFLELSQEMTNQAAQHRENTVVVLVDDYDLLIKHLKVSFEEWLLEGFDDNADVRFIFSGQLSWSYLKYVGIDFQFNGEIQSLPIGLGDGGLGDGALAPSIQFIDHILEKSDIPLDGLSPMDKRAIAKYAGHSSYHIRQLLAEHFSSLAAPLASESASEPLSKKQPSTTHLNKPTSQFVRQQQKRVLEQSWPLTGDKTKNLRRYLKLVINNNGWIDHKILNQESAYQHYQGSNSKLEIEVETTLGILEDMGYLCKNDEGSWQAQPPYLFQGWHRHCTDEMLCSVAFYLGLKQLLSIRWFEQQQDHNDFKMALQKLAEALECRNSVLEIYDHLVEHQLLSQIPAEWLAWQCTLELAGRTELMADLSADSLAPYQYD